MNFDQIDSYQEAAEKGKEIANKAMAA